MSTSPVSPRFVMTCTDEGAEVTLVSTDQIHFKVHSYLLKTHSSVLRDMLIDPGLKPTAISLEVPSGDLKLFLDLMHQSEPDMSNNWPQCKRVIDLCLLYDCKIVLERLRFRLKPLAHQAPWEIFCMASQCEDVSLARKALKSMGNDEEHRTLVLTSLSLKDATRPSLPFLLGLIVQLHQKCEIRMRYQIGLGTFQGVDWNTIGRAFEPIT
ncbi:uncharacterized protein L199_000651 [Kwoniella botswanensis]|uniref:uncharacterized protein n=1 Tax=Kwoniella botswanensis TaxID=1268659 RepID=UPI00315CDDFF